VFFFVPYVSCVRVRVAATTVWRGAPPTAVLGGEVRFCCCYSYTGRRKMSETRNVFFHDEWWRRSSRLLPSSPARQRFSTARGGAAEGVEKSERSPSTSTHPPHSSAETSRPGSRNRSRLLVPAAAITLTDVFPSFSPAGTYLSSTVFASVFFSFFSIYILFPFIFCYCCCAFCVFLSIP